MSRTSTREPDPRYRDALVIHLAHDHGHDRDTIGDDTIADLEAFHDDDHGSPDLAPDGFVDHAHEENR